MSTQKCTNIDTIDEKQNADRPKLLEGYLMTGWDQDRERSERHQREKRSPRVQPSAVAHQRQTQGSRVRGGQERQEQGADAIALGHQRSVSQRNAACGLGLCRTVRGLS